MSGKQRRRRFEVHRTPPATRASRVLPAPLVYGAALALAVASAAWPILFLLAH